MFIVFFAAVAGLDVQSNWQIVGRGRDGSDFYLDTSTLEEIDNDRVKIWTRRSHVPKSRYDHEKIQITFDCSKHESRYEAVISYKASGEIAKDNYKAEKEFSPVIPNSADWKTMTIACGITQSSASSAAN